MTFKDMLKKITGVLPRESDEIDTSAKDRRLDSLRKQRQIQLNEIEKKKLRNEIIEYNKKKFEQNMYGHKYLDDRKVNILKKKFNLLEDKQPLLKQKKRYA